MLTLEQVIAEMEELVTACMGAGPVQVEAWRIALKAERVANAKKSPKQRQMERMGCHANSGSV
jgi:hypothetical protein